MIRISARLQFRYSNKSSKSPDAIILPEYPHTMFTIDPYILVTVSEFRMEENLVIAPPLIIEAAATVEKKSSPHDEVDDDNDRVHDDIDMEKSNVVEEKKNETRMEMEEARMEITSPDKNYIHGSSTPALKVEEDDDDDEEIYRGAVDPLDWRSAQYNEWVGRVTASNPLEIALPALRTISTILCNVLTFPRDNKYRVIKMSNKVFQTKIAPTTGAVDLLLAMGFVEDEMNETLELPAATKVFELSELLMILNKVTSDFDGDGSIQSDSNRNIDETHRRRPEEKSDADIQVVAPSAEFDPYQPSIFRTAIQPRGDRSITEIRLEELRIKQKLIEGEIPLDIDSFRSAKVGYFAIYYLHVKYMFYVYLQVILPFAIATVRSEGKTSSELSVEGQGTLSDGRVQARGLAARILSMGGSGGEGSDAPLQTRALRELEAAKKSKVYSHSLVKIR
jgi:hypothetical protein